jgi:phosphatidylglycerophosphate synthase
VKIGRVSPALAHSLTGFRLVLAVPFFWAMQGQDRSAASVAAACLAGAIASDLLDGPVARWQCGESAFGRLFDHATDCAFVTSGMIAGALRQAFPWLLPFLVATAFVQYVADSYGVRRSRELRMSRLGRWNGVLYFIPLAADAASRLGVPGLRAAIRAGSWVLVATTLLSIADRARALRSPPPSTPCG